ncbi:MAG: hypothetical protein MI861_03970 [Pirellulales bacterium]|nr:hypothetical protein [Pirellulales bacterium]
MMELAHVKFPRQRLEKPDKKPHEHNHEGKSGSGKHQQANEVFHPQQTRQAQQKRKTGLIPETPSNLSHIS